MIDNDEVRRDGDGIWWLLPTCLLPIVIAILALLLLAGCKTKYVPYPEYHTQYIVRTDTVKTTDSIIVGDKTYVYTSGDTVYVRQTLWRDRWHYDYKAKVDTMHLIDSIPYHVPVEKIVEVEKPLSFFQKCLMTLGGMAGIILLVGAICWVRKFLSVRS